MNCCREEKKEHREERRRHSQEAVHGRFEKETVIGLQAEKPEKEGESRRHHSGGTRELEKLARGGGRRPPATFFWLMDSGFMVMN